jgi:hypothetical protein
MTVDCTIIDINLIIVGGIHQSVAAFEHTGTRGERRQDQEFGDGEPDRFVSAGLPTIMPIDSAAALQRRADNVALHH